MFDFSETNPTALAVSSGYEFELKNMYHKTSFGYMPEFHPKK